MALPICWLTLVSLSRIALTAIVVSCKMYDDNYATNTYYAAVGGVDAEELKQLELVFMAQMEWRVFVKLNNMVLLRSQLMNFSYNFETQQYSFKKGFLGKMTRQKSMIMPKDHQET